MTRANTDQFKYIPWFAKAGAACSIIPISRFVGPSIFQLKGGGYLAPSELPPIHLLRILPSEKMKATLVGETAITNQQVGLFDTQ